MGCAMARHRICYVSLILHLSLYVSIIAKNLGLCLQTLGSFWLNSFQCSKCLTSSSPLFLCSRLSSSFLVNLTR